MVVITYRRFGTTYLSHLQGKMGQIFCPETSVRNYYYLLHNNSEKRSSHMLSKTSERNYH